MKGKLFLKQLVRLVARLSVGKKVNNNNIVIVKYMYMDIIITIIL